MMAKIHETWKVLPHEPIEKITENLWRVQGSLENMPLNRVMTIAKRSDGTLAIHNAMALEPELMTQIENWGSIKYLLVPNSYHRLDAKIFQHRYPQAQLLCPKGSKKEVSKVVLVHGTYEDFPSDSWVSLQTLEGVGEKEGVMIVSSADGITLVFNDVLFNMPHVKGFSGFVLRHITQSTGGPRINGVARLFIVKDKLALQKHLLHLAEIAGLRRIIVSHHLMVSNQAKEVLQTVSKSLS